MKHFRITEVATGNVTEYDAELPQPEQQPEPVVTDTALQISNIVMGATAQLSKEQTHG